MRFFWRCRQFFGSVWQRFTKADFSRLKLYLRRSVCRLNPFSWGERTVKVVLALFVSLVLPLYLYFGLQPNIPADAASYPRLVIPGIQLDTPVEELELEDRQLNVPDMIAGSYSSEPNKTLIVGHSSTVFEDLDQLEIGQELTYNDRNYEITYLEVLAKEKISMRKVLAGATEDTLILMTCAGESLPNQDATHRLIITAQAK